MKFCAVFVFTIVLLAGKCRAGDDSDESGSDQDESIFKEARRYMGECAEKIKIVEGVCNDMMDENADRGDRGLPKMASGAVTKTASSQNILINCKKCNKKVTNGVSCDKCGVNFHFKCAGLNRGETKSSVNSDYRWECVDCDVVVDCDKQAKGYSTVPTLAWAMGVCVCERFGIMVGNDYDFAKLEVLKKRFNKQEYKTAAEKALKPCGGVSVGPSQNESVVNIASCAFKASPKFKEIVTNMAKSFSSSD